MSAKRFSCRLCVLTYRMPKAYLAMGNPNKISILIDCPYACTMNKIPQICQLWVALGTVSFDNIRFHTFAFISILSVHSPRKANDKQNLGSGDIPSIIFYSCTCKFYRNKISYKLWFNNKSLRTMSVGSIWVQSLITARKRILRRLCFYTCL